MLRPPPRARQMATAGRRAAPKCCDSPADFRSVRDRSPAERRHQASRLINGPRKAGGGLL